MLHLVLFGPPGSGKGTQALQLKEQYNLLHLSTGDIFRYEMKNNTTLGLQAKAFIDAGKLVPDEVTVGMVESTINRLLTPDYNGIVFDGFPRTIAQAEALDYLLEQRGDKINVVLSLEVGDDELTRRMIERGKTSGRSDDANPEVVKNRIAVYKNETFPLADYYHKQQKLVGVQGEGTVENIFDSLCTATDAAKR